MPSGAILRCNSKLRENFEDFRILGDKNVYLSACSYQGNKKRKSLVHRTVKKFGKLGTDMGRFYAEIVH